MNDVETSTVTEEMTRALPGRRDWGQQAPSPAASVERHPRADGDDADARNVRLGAALPLAKGQERDVVPRGGQMLGEVSVPALGSADRVRV